MNRRSPQQSLRVWSWRKKPSDPDPEVLGKDFGDFEFRLEDSVTMLPADELFSDGNIVHLHPSMIQLSVTTSESSSPETSKSRWRTEVSRPDHLFSTKAPRCSSRWKQLLGLKKHLNNNAQKETNKMASSLPYNSCNNSKSFKKIIHRNSKSSIDSRLSLPLLNDSDIDSVSISSRLSLSSSSSGHEYDDLPRLSLDSEKPIVYPNPSAITKNSNLNSTPPSVRVVKHKIISSENPTRVGRSPMRRAPDSTTATVRGLSADSPRINSSGKIVFQGLERSSSSPNCFNGGPRIKHRGMERSYSANVRVTPVLNVPVCSLRGSSKSVFRFQLFSSFLPKRGLGAGGSNGGGNKGHQSNVTNRIYRA